MNRFQSSLIASPLLLEPTWGKQSLPMLEKLMGKDKPAQSEADPLPEPYCFNPGDVRAAGKVLFSEASGQLVAGSVGVMEIIGPIWKYGSYWAYGTMDYVATLENMLATPEIGAILIVDDSPGGQASGIAELYDVIRLASKPIIVLIRGMAASAGYYAICGAQEIWASQGSDQIGSIGVYITLVDFSGFYAQMGIKLIEVYSRLSGQKNIESRAAKDGDIGPMQDMLDGLVTYFHNAVKASRGDKLKMDLADPTQGGVFFADQALTMGLIDKIGSFRQALDRAFELATNSNSDSPMAIFDKHAKLTALKGVEASAVTDEQIEAVNANLTEMGILGVTVLRTTDVDALESLETTNTSLTAQVGTLTTQLATANAEVTRLGAQPGATPTAVVKEDEPVAETGKDEKPNFYSETDETLAKLKASLK